MRRQLALILFFFGLLFSFSLSLSRLNLIPGSTTISGISSGADFTVQFFVSHSSKLLGMGVFAGELYSCAVIRFPMETVTTCAAEPDSAKGPGCVGGVQTPAPCVGCPQGTTLIYDHCKNNPEIVTTLQPIRDRIEELENLNFIDSTHNLRDTRIYLYRGTQDTTYLNNSVSIIADLFSPYLLSPQNQVKYVGDIQSSHAWPTLNFGAPCGTLGLPPAIQNCNYDGAGEMLQYLFENNLVQPTTDNPQGDVPLENVNQTEYFGENFAGLASTGYIYIPKSCAAMEPCRLHIAFHGCGMMELNPQMGLNFTLNLGLNRWADSNNLVILYPQSGGYVEFKDKYHTDSYQQRGGCWDSYGQTGELYTSKNALQIQVVESMADALGWR